MQLFLHPYVVVAIGQLDLEWYQPVLLLVHQGSVLVLVDHLYRCLQHFQRHLFAAQFF